MFKYPEFFFMGAGILAFTIWALMLPVYPEASSHAWQSFDRTMEDVADHVFQT